MRATDIIRGVLDLIDQVECAQELGQVEPIAGEFAQTFAKLSAERVTYDNSPAPVLQGIEAVSTAAGLGGTNGPKQPSDLRANSISMYPSYQAENKGQ
jgi:hypothetical protein